jgi:hypothetical protein
MADFNVRADSVNVEQIMEQIRARIREKRGVDYTEQQIRELAAVKLEKFLDPRSVRSDLLEYFRKTPPPPERPNYEFGEDTLFETHRGFVRWLRRLLQPILKLFFNPNPLIQALHIQSQLNTINAKRESTRHGIDQLYYELIHNLVVETTRAGIEIKNLKMRVESLASRVEFNERRARALESVVAYKPENERQIQQRGSRPPAPIPIEDRSASQGAPSAAPGGAAAPAVGEGPGQRSRRRRRRRGRRGRGPAAAVMDGEHAAQAETQASEPLAPEDLGTFTGAKSHPSEPPTPPGSDRTPDGDDDSQ